MWNRLSYGARIMIPFALVLLLLVSGVFTLMYMREQAHDQKNLESYARSMAGSVLAVRTIFTENQDRINHDGEGRLRFKSLNPSAGANAFIKKVNGSEGKKIKQTSSLPRKPEDAPDNWEKKALAIFESDRNVKEFGEINTTGDTPEYRFAIPLYIDYECLKCHGEPKDEPDISGYLKEGYKLGDLRGAITVSLPLRDYYAARNGKIILFACLAAGIILLIMLVQQKIVDSLQRMANTDRLTRVYNRNALYDRLRQEITQALMNRMPLSVIIFDLDHFKRVNDIYGHLVGDEVLKNTATIAGSLLRRGDILARFGGEEFVIVSPNTGLSGAMALAERLRQAVADAEIRYGDTVIKITISAGVSTLPDQIRDNDINAVRDALLDRADKALYRAKNTGRNRVES